MNDAEIRALTKAELHLHIEGTLEPEMMFALAARNDVALPYADVDAVRRAYVFADLQEFLDLYYLACRVLISEADFAELTWAYLERAHIDGVRHVEMFFDPQTHTARGVAFETVVSGIGRSLDRAAETFGMSSRLIMCVLRHLPASDAEATLDQALEHRDRIAGIGLDSGEAGNPPERFAAVFERARAAGLWAVAHAGEEGPPEYIRQALDRLGARRIDHGVRCLEDPALVQRLVREAIPLTVCPLSNVRLQVVAGLDRHPLAEMLERGLMVTVNSDDPAYFGGYIGDNLIACRDALTLDDAALGRLCRNSLMASVLSDPRRGSLLDELDGLTTGRVAP